MFFRSVYTFHYSLFFWDSRWHFKSVSCRSKFFLAETLIQHCLWNYSLKVGNNFFQNDHNSSFKGPHQRIIIINPIIINFLRVINSSVLSRLIECPKNIQISQISILTHLVFIYCGIWNTITERYWLLRL